MAESIEMKNSYENFPDKEENEEAETSFGGRQDDDEFEDAQENLLYDKKKDIKRELPTTQDEKRKELKRYFGDSVYNDSESRQFLYNLTFQESGTAEGEVEIFYKGIEIATADIKTGKVLSMLMDNRIKSGYEKDHQNIINYRNNTFKGQIEENTGEVGYINELVEKTTRLKLALEIDKRKDLKNAGEHIEMVQLQEDQARIDRGKKVETPFGREILDRQVRHVRRYLQFKEAVSKIPGIGFLLASVVGVVTTIVLLGKGLSSDASKNIRPSKKKKSDDIIDSSLQKAQEISSEILEEAGDNFEILVGIATIIFVIYKKK